MFTKISETFDQAMQTLRLAESPRKAELERLAQYLTTKAQAGEIPKLIVICTHNSRRSHLGQFWLAVAGAQFEFDLESYSGGTDATACHPNTLAALQRAGAEVTALSAPPNPRYKIGYGEDLAIEAWSKVFSDVGNPQTGFAALMVCTDADEACPIVPGAEARFALPYLDPKHADGTPDEPAAYDLASQTIAGEMAWVVASQPSP
jgi:hypothetical protein